MAFVCFFVYRFSWGCSYLFKMKRDNRSFACCFYLEFWHENAEPNVRRVYVSRLTVGKEVCCSFGRRKHVARHRNYRLVLSLRSRYRRKTKKRLPPKNYRHILVLPPPPKSLPPKNEKPPTAETLPPYGITAEKLPTHFCFTGSTKVVTAKKRKTAYRRKITASAKVVTAKKRKTAHRRKITAAWHYLPCPPKKALPTITLAVFAQIGV